VTKFVVVIGFLVSFAAGLMVGSIDRKRTEPPAAPTTAPTTRPHRGGGWITSELGLDADQQKAMEQIWSETAGKGRRELEERRREIRKDRDEALTALVRPEDKPKYDQILKDYQDQQQAIESEMRANFEMAVKQTKELLTPEQRAKYEQLLQRQQWDRGGPRGGPGRRGDDRPASRPATQTST
jgi:Spy/CpxP family protein refolding chaperone